MSVTSGWVGTAGGWTCGREGGRVGGRVGGREGAIKSCTALKDYHMYILRSPVLENSHTN